MSQKIESAGAVVFISHGAPDVLLNAPETLACWRELAAGLPRPQAIVVVSAHWEARVATVSLAIAPETIHDYSGFPAALSAMRYPVSGSLDWATRVVRRLAGAGIAVETHPDRGMDHGAWVPLLGLFPQADIPVVQLALAHGSSPDENVRLGAALAGLREEGVLILTSGAITHNFRWLNWRGTPPPLPQATQFTEWVAARLAAQDVAALCDYRNAPSGAAAHPTEEHFLPLLIAVGATTGETPQRYQPPFTYGSLAMDAYVWGGVLGERNG